MIIVGEGVKTKDPFFMALTIFWIISIPVQWIFYIGNVFRNKTVSKETSWLWVYLLFGGNILAFPFYWFFHIWRDSDEIPSPSDKPVLKTSCFNSKKSQTILLLTSFLPFVFF
jgi:hypothetical protein